MKREPDEDPMFDSQGLFSPSWWGAPPPRRSERTIRRLSPYNPKCWLAEHGRFENGPMPPCEGRLVKVHLLKQEVIKRELSAEVAKLLLWDPRVWVWGCGGPMGISGHHGAFDTSKRLRIPRSAISADLEELCKQHDLVWWIDFTYRRRARPGARTINTRVGTDDRS